MNLRFSCPLCIFVVAAWLFHGTADAQAQAGKARQRISNGGFEKGLAGWKTKGVELVEDPTVAHGGVRCLLGEVRRRREGREIRRRLKLRSDRLYRLSLWARADNKSRLTIWLHEDGKKTIIGNWHGVSKQWRHYRANFTVDADGPATIRVIAPSSFWAPVGRMWIDDVSLFELPLWPQIEISGGGGFNDFPVMIKTGPRTAWVAWISFRKGHDTLQVARIKLSGAKAGFELEKKWKVTGGADARILNPTLAGDGENGAWLVYSAEQGKNWDLYAVRLVDNGPQKKIRVTRHPGADVHPAASLRGRTLWIAWESNRDDGRRQVYATALREGRPGSPQRLSAPGTNNYAPAVASADPGPMWVAWHSFRDNNYDLYGRPLSGGSFGVERRLTSAPGIDRNVRLEAGGRQIWMAWEHAAYTGYFLGKATIKRVQVARLRDGQLRAPVGLKKTRLWSQAESPDLKLDERGRLWVAARVPRDRNSGWDVILWRYGPETWSSPRVLSRRKGMNRRPSIAVFDSVATVCYQSDDMPGRWKSVEESSRGTSGVFLASVENSLRSNTGRLKLTHYKQPKDRFEAASKRVALGEDRIGWNISHRGRKLRLLFGDLHEHSDLSVCDRTRDETPDQTYQMMRDIARYDFGGLTDHGKCFNAYLWSHLGKITRANHDPGRFLTLLAQEWTSTFERKTKKYPYGYYGHRNLFLSDPFFPKWYNAALDITPAELWAQLRKDRADYVLIPHQLADTGNVPVDWDFHDENAEPVAEIFQFRGSYECDGCPRQANLARAEGHFLQDAWARGIVVGVVASPDHEGGLGKAAVYTGDFTRKGILDSLRKRRTYGTTGAKIFLDVRVNGLFMGEVGDPPGKQPVRVQVRVDCPGPIRAVEVLRNNQVVFKAKGKDRSMQVTYVDDPPPKGPAYYYVRVTQKDEELAWSSPVWLGRKDSR